MPCEKGRHHDHGKMNTYLHTQRAGRWLVVPLAASLAMVLAAVLTGIWSILTGIPVLGLMAWLFASMTIEISEGELRWRFGPGLIRKRVPLSQVEKVRPVVTSMADGWGIHLTKFGWLYNVAGFTAVAIQMQNGQQFALGTDDVAGLITAVAARVQSA